MRSSIGWARRTLARRDQVGPKKAASGGGARFSRSRSTVSVLNQGQNWEGDLEVGGVLYHVKLVRGLTYGVAWCVKGESLDAYSSKISLQEKVGN
eukprot:1771047-Prymnesium_polylepis.1